MSTTLIDVLIVGAGPVGLFLANEFARFDLQFRIVEKNSSRSTWSKSLLITSRTLNILENCGLHEEILAKGTIMEGVDIHFRGQSAGSFDFDFDRPATRYPIPFILGQPDVEEALERVLQSRGAKVERGSEVVGITVRGDYVDVRLASGEQLKSRYVVGCDGAHSFVRKCQPNWSFEGRPVNLLWAQCDGTVSDSRIRTTRAGGFFGSSGFALRIPVNHHQRRFRFILHVPPEVAQLDRTGDFNYGRLESRAPTLPQMNDLLRLAMGDMFSEVTNPTGLSYFIVQERMVADLRHEKRLFLAGDAAHCHSPAGGQGMNMAHNLAWKLGLVVKRQSKDPERLLRSFSEERIPIIRKTIGMTHRMVKGTTLASGRLVAWLLRPIVSTVFFIISHCRALRHAIIPIILQSTLRISASREGILSNEKTGIVKPGMMFPDPPCPVFCITASPSSTIGTTHLLPLLLDSYKYVAVFFIGDLVLHEPHPLFLRFNSLCEQFKSLRLAIIARLHRIGGLRKPDWAEGEILFLATDSGKTDRAYGLNGRNEMGLVISRPDGYVMHSTRVDSSGVGFERAENWLQLYLF